MKTAPASAAAVRVEREGSTDMIPRYAQYAPTPTAVHTRRYPPTNAGDAAGLCLRPLEILQCITTMGATEGNIMATIMVTHIPMNRGAAIAEPAMSIVMPPAPRERAVIPGAMAPPSDCLAASTHAAADRAIRAAKMRAIDTCRNALGDPVAGRETAPRADTDRIVGGHSLVVEFGQRRQSGIGPVQARWVVGARDLNRRPPAPKADTGQSADLRRCTGEPELPGERPYQ